MITVGLTVLLVISVLSGGVAWWKWLDAEEQTLVAQEQTKIAQQKEMEAEKQKRLALESEKKAKEQTNEALITQSLFLSDLSRQEIDDGSAVNGMLLALEGLPKNENRPYVAEAEEKLYSAVLNYSEYKMSERLVLEGGNAVFSPDGKTIATTEENTIKLWQVETGKLLHTLKGHEEYVGNAAFSPDGKLVVTSSDDKTARLWKVFSTQELVNYANEIVPRCLSIEQRKKFFLPESKGNLLFAKAENQAKEGKINEAIAMFKQAKEAAPCLKINPEDKAKRVASMAIFAKGEKLAKEGKLQEAVVEFKEAMQIDYRIKLADPEDYAQRLKQ